MRRHLVQYLLGLGLAGATACSPNSFDVTLVGQTTIDGDPSTAGSPLTRIPAIGSLASVDFGTSEEFKHAGVTKQGVQSIKVTDAVLQVVVPGTQGFDFLDEVSFVASAAGQEALVASTREIAQLNLPAPNPVLALDVVPDVELRGFLEAPTVSIAVRGTGRVPPMDTTLKATVRLKVVLKVF